MLMITPRASSGPSGSAATMYLAPSLAQRKLPIRLIAIVFWNIAASCAAPRDTVFAAGAMPAQFTTIRGVPRSMATVAKPCETLTASDTSTETNRPPRVVASICPLVVSTSKIATRMPRSANACAVAAPSPDAAPVTTATCPNQF